MEKHDIVHIRFLDHVQDGSKPIEFEVFGRIARINKTSVTVLTWGYPNKLKKNENTNYFTIVRSCITGSKIFSSSLDG